ncbi:MAG: hypothetical protein GF393_05660, partial [Armatimonadia bacterium]|nr:hypothetical protein [Armatimonadia bacterium]
MGSRWLRVPRTLFGILIVAGIMATVLAGCSGGNGPTLPSPDGPSDGIPDDGDRPNDGDQPDDGDPPDDGQLSNSDTVAAVEDYGEQYVQMLNEGMTIPEAMEQAAREMEASGQFSSVAVGPDGLAVWAEFTNGWPFVLLGNR